MIVQSILIVTRVIRVTRVTRVTRVIRVRNMILCDDGYDNKEEVGHPSVLVLSAYAPDATDA